MDDFEREFILEAVEEISDNLERLYEIITDLEKGLDVSDVYNEIFRLVHNVKGNSKSAGFDSFSSIVHELETKLLPFREGEKKFSKVDIEILDSCYSVFTNSLDEIKSNLSCDLDFTSLSKDIEKFGEAEDSPSTTHNYVQNQDHIENKKPYNEVKYNFLIVDDEESICEILSEYLLHTFNCDVLSLYDGEAAFKSCQKNQYDLIITDFNMPKMNGLVFLENLRKGHTVNKDTPVIFSSGYNPDLTPESIIWENVLILNKVVSFNKLNFSIQCLLHTKKSA